MKASSLVPGQEFDAGNCNLHIDHQPNYGDLRRWAEEHMQHMVRVGNTDFQSTLDNFVFEYTRARVPGKHAALPKVSTAIPVLSIQYLYLAV
jgi:hypothetical protein